MTLIDRPPASGPLPGLPGGGRGQRALMLVLAGLIVLDRVWLHGALFAHRMWDVMRWAIAAAGLLLGTLAYSGLIR